MVNDDDPSVTAEPVSEDDFAAVDRSDGSAFRRLDRYPVGEGVCVEPSGPVPPEGFYYLPRYRPFQGALQGRES